MNTQGLKAFSSLIALPHCKLECFHFVDQAMITIILQYQKHLYLSDLMNLRLKFIEPSHPQDLDLTFITVHCSFNIQEIMQSRGLL